MVPETLGYSTVSRPKLLLGLKSFIEFSGREIFRLHKGKAFEIFEA
jgi:hypothetical protein